MEISRGVGIQLQLDQATRDGDYNFYGRVLVDVDLMDNLPSSLMIERDDHRGFTMEVVYENLPNRYAKYNMFGHDATKCRLNVSNSARDRGRSCPCQPKSRNQQASTENDNHITTNQDRVADLILPANRDHIVVNHEGKVNGDGNEEPLRQDRDCRTPMTNNEINLVEDQDTEFVPIQNQ